MKVKAPGNDGTTVDLIKPINIKILVNSSPDYQHLNPVQITVDQSFLGYILYKLLKFLNFICDQLRFRKMSPHH